MRRLSVQIPFEFFLPRDLILIFLFLRIVVWCKTFSFSVDWKKISHHHHRLFSVFDQDQPSAMLINSIWPWRIAPNWRRCIFWIAHGMISPVPNNIWSDFFSAGNNVVQEQYTIYVGGVFQLVLLSLLILRSATIRWGMSCRENLLSTLGSDYCHSNYSWIQSQFFSNAACSP